MSVSADSIKELLSSENLGDRLRAVNQIRELEPQIGLELVQIAIGDSSARVRYSAVSQMDTLGIQDLPLSLTILRGLLHDPEADVQAAAAAFEKLFGSESLRKTMGNSRYSRIGTQNWRFGKTKHYRQCKLRAGESSVDGEHSSGKSR